MLKKLSLIFILAMAAMLLLVSCQRSASQAPLATPTGNSTIAAGQATPPSRIEIIQTQTAVYVQTIMITPVVGLPTSPPSGTPDSLTLVPPTGAATTPEPGITPVVIVPTSTPGRPESYNLQQGEQPYCIARRFNVNQNELLILNGLDTASASKLPEGYVLRIPQSGNPFVGSRTLLAHPGTHTVSSTNDTIYSIACEIGDVDPTQIIAANGLVSPYTLHINQLLNIP